MRGANVVILVAGTFKVSTYRKAIPATVKRIVRARHPEIPAEGWKLYQYDHRPALTARAYDTEAGDFIPPQNDPNHIEPVLKAEHDRRTFGRTPGAERTVTTRGSDVGERARSNKIRESEAEHQLKLERNDADLKDFRERIKRRWPSRPFPTGRKL